MKHPPPPWTRPINTFVAHDMAKTYVLCSYGEPSFFCHTDGLPFPLSVAVWSVRQALACVVVVILESARLIFFFIPVSSRPSFLLPLAFAFTFPLTLLLAPSSLILVLVTWVSSMRPMRSSFITIIIVVVVFSVVALLLSLELLSAHFCCGLSATFPFSEKIPPATTDRENNPKFKRRMRGAQ